LSPKQQILDTAQPADTARLTTRPASHKFKKRASQNRKIATREQKTLLGCESNEIQEIHLSAKFSLTTSTHSSSARRRLKMGPRLGPRRCRSWLDWEKESEGWPIGGSCWAQGAGGIIGCLLVWG